MLEELLNINHSDKNSKELSIQNTPRYSKRPKTFQIENIHISDFFLLIGGGKIFCQKQMKLRLNMRFLLIGGEIILCSKTNEIVLEICSFSLNNNMRH